MDRDDLCRVGIALYGPRWQTQLAADLSVNNRTLRRWVAGEINIPPGVVSNLATLCKTKAAILAELSATLTPTPSA